MVVLIFFYVFLKVCLSKEFCSLIENNCYLSMVVGVDSYFTKHLSEPYSIKSPVSVLMKTSLDCPNF